MPTHNTKIIAINAGRLALMAIPDLRKKEGGESYDYGYPHQLASHTPEDEIFRFKVGGSDYEAFELPKDFILPEGMEYVGLREAYGVLPEDEWRAAAKAAELINWNRSTRYCAACNGELHRASEISKKCNDCGKEYFPSPAPCVITLVLKGRGDEQEALLVHASTFTRPFFGLVAGFVETGETLEEAVAREIKEETGLEVEDIRYFGSQSWPFPSQLMVGFTARWKSGDVCFADGELTDGGFYRREDVPPIPTPPSIARKLIDAWLSGQLT